ncbi:uncharacterized protein LOC117218901 isoform X1 [Megalopta genalis]|uniref:uncharacterized protein LOC117218901 isoform X1 n=1 Tax=Megalopta genalis TaxID=115081 RepID=UPI003FD50269
MDVFRESYSTYCFVLCMTGLWPDDESLLTRIQRVAFTLLIISCIVVQATTLKTAELTLYNALIMLSYSFPMILYFLRYSWFVMNISEIRAVFESIGRDYSTMKDPLELGMFMKHMAETRRVIMAYIVLAALIAAYIIVAILVPTILHSKLQLRYLRMFGFFYNEENAQTDWVGLQLVLIHSIQSVRAHYTDRKNHYSTVNPHSTCLLESFTFHNCFLFFCTLYERIHAMWRKNYNGIQVARHRVHAAVKDVANSTSSRQIDIQSAIQIHQRAVELAAQLGKCMTYSYLMAIVAVVLSFAVNLYRLLLAAKNADDVENLFFSASLTLSHILIMFLDNHSGQKLVSTSVEVFHETYNSLWYCIPPRSQKLLLFLLMRSIEEVQYNFAGLFVPCYEGFSMLMSSSFSYFTVLISVQ